MRLIPEKLVYSTATVTPISIAAIMFMPGSTIWMMLATVLS